MKAAHDGARAEAALAVLQARDPALRSQLERHQKSKRDLCVMRLGRRRLRSSLVELPQFWNAFRDEMSLIGLRPKMSDQADCYPRASHNALRPGVTGP